MFFHWGDFSQIVLLGSCRCLLHLPLPDTHMVGLCSVVVYMQYMYTKEGNLERGGNMKAGVNEVRFATRAVCGGVRQQKTHNGHVQCPVLNGHEACSHFNTRKCY